MTHRAAVRAGVVLALVSAAVIAGCAATSRAVDAARLRDTEVADAKAGEIERSTTAPWVVVENGAISAFGATSEEALRAAPQGRATAHRFVFRAADRGDRMHRLTFLPDGGAVAGRRLLTDLGCRIVSVSTDGAGRLLVLEHRGVRRTLDLAKSPSLRLELSPLGEAAAKSATMALAVPLDPDFDGPLVLTAESARPLDLARSEIPGRAEVQAAVGRPFSGRRAWAAATCPELDASGVVEVVVPDSPRRR